MIEYIGRRIKTNNEGFTLIELVVVIAILSILIGIAVPKLGESRKRAAVTAHNANVRTIESAATMYIADEKEDIKTRIDVEKTDIKDYLQEVPRVPKGAYKAGDANLKYQIKIENGNIDITPGFRYIENGEVKNGLLPEQ